MCILQDGKTASSYVLSTRAGTLMYSSWEHSGLGLPAWFYHGRDWVSQLVSATPGLADLNPVPILFSTRPSSHILAGSRRVRPDRNHEKLGIFSLLGKWRCHRGKSLGALSFISVYYESLICRAKSIYKAFRKMLCDYQHQVSNGLSVFHR